MIKDAMFHTTLVRIAGFWHGWKVVYLGCGLFGSITPISMFVRFGQ